ncbi:MAG: Na+-dependent transporter [Betaproteobacteria bacterium]|nr:Na+-dependent transporter [Betaproteobacteria bacterium]
MERPSRVVLHAPAAVLSWLGQQGTRAVAALIVIGVAMPPIGALLKPFVTEAVFVLLCIAFLRVDAAAFRSYLRRPRIVLAATAWTSLVIPMLLGATYRAFGLDEQSPDLFLALVLQATAPPLMAAPALAALMGLDATLVLCTMITSTALLPFTALLFAHVFLGPALTLPPLALGLKLFAILAGSALVGLTMRRIAGATAIERQSERIDGLNILVLFVFIAAVMESVAGRFIATPMLTIGLVALAFVVFFAVLCLTTLLFASAGRERALTLGFTASQRNVGLMLAATSGVLPDLAWLYFAFCYFPMYLSPLLLQPLARRVIDRAPTTPAPPRGPLK